MDTEGWAGKYTSIALDSFGYPHISYYERINDDLRYAWYGYSPGVSSPPISGRQTSTTILAYPNPFSTSTTIRLTDLGQRVDPSTNSGQGSMELEIIDAAGCLVKRFSLPTAYSILPTGVTWDGRDDFGKLLLSGIYYCRLSQGNRTETRKILFMK
ncbi:T9SS type A sorting domain-containing protein [candidate division WOR-3 bacterium]|nr:T9SS type A sorting domain-containing protein [candidate division WOR-3 bacterium]